MTMGEKILNMRKARGWNQEELAERIGVTRQAVSRWESDSAKPDADKIIAICDLFGVSADYLLRVQYTGDAVGVSVREKQKNGITSKQAIGLGLLSLGLLILFGLTIVCLIHPHTHYMDDRVYTGLWAYVTVYNLYWMIWVLGIVIGSGAVLLCWDGFAALWRKIHKK